MKHIFTLTGPTCSGKTTLFNGLLETGYFEGIISTTSRSPRLGEVDDVSYYFKSEEECEELLSNGEFVEYVSFSGNHYGIEFDELERVRKTGKTPLVIVEPKGLKALKKEFKCYASFLHCSLGELYRRFLERLRDNPGADLGYEAKRLMDIANQKDDWWGELIYDNYILPFTWENRYDTINELVNKAIHLGELGNSHD